MSGGNESYKRWNKPTRNIFKEDGTLKKGQTYQGYYIVRNKEKYMGDPSLVVFRSAWEFSFCMWADYSDSILNWSSEPIKIPYYDKVSKLEECRKLGLNPNNPSNWVQKNYNTDFWIRIQKPDGNIEKWFIEVKPKHKLSKPKPVPPEAPLRDQKRFNRLAKEFLINEAKFEAMTSWTTRNGASFYIFTEDQLDKFGIVHPVSSGKLSRFDIRRKENKYHIRTV
jgi:hypothetical protein